MSEIINHDFGKKDREAIRTFARLMKIAEDHEAALLANPIPYYEKAGKEIARLHSVIREAWEALQPDIRTYAYAPDEPISVWNNTITVPKDEWERLKKAAEIIKKTKL